MGISASPRFFKDVRILHFRYQNQKKRWMTGEFFSKWMEGLDHGFGVKDREIELLVDNCPAHPTIEGPINIYVVFLPPNGTSVPILWIKK